MKIIAISGKAGSGKDTFAEMLKKQGELISVRPLAEPVKKLAIELGWNGIKDVYGRQLLQNIGALFRAYDENYWVSSLIHTIDHDCKHREGVIVPDCRYPNEIETLKTRFNVTTIRIVRPDFDNGLTLKQKEHASETTLDTYGFDYVVYNNSTITDLEHEAEYIWDMVFYDA